MTPLPAIPAAASVSALLPPALRDGLGEHLDLFLDAPTWPERMRVVDHWLTVAVAGRGNLDHTLMLLTAMLEERADRDVEVVEQAVLYRISLHRSWQKSAMRFLANATPATGWVEQYPAVAAVALGRMGRDALN